MSHHSEAALRSTSERSTLLRIGMAEVYHGLMRWTTRQKLLLLRAVLAAEGAYSYECLGSSGDLEVLYRFSYN